MALTMPVFIAGMFTDDAMVSPTILAANILIFATAFVFGDAVRSRRQLLVELEFRAETAEPRSEGMMARKETMDLIRAYYQLGERPRRRLLDLAKSLNNDVALPG